MAEAKPPAANVVTVITTVQPGPVGWDPQAPKYRCCCGCCHVLSGAKVITWYSTAVAVIALLQALATGGVTFYIVLLLDTVHVGLMHKANASKDPRDFKAPTIFSYVYGILINICAVLFIILVGLAGDESSQGADVLLAVIAILDSLTYFWFGYVFSKAGDYLRDMQMAYPQTQAPQRY